MRWRGNVTALFHRGDHVPRLVGDPLACRVCGDAGQPHSLRADLDEEQDMQATERHGVDTEEVARHDPGGWGADEDAPRRRRSPRRGVDAVGGENAADRSGRDSIAEPSHFALDQGASVRRHPTVRGHPDRATEEAIDLTTHPRRRASRSFGSAGTDEDVTFGPTSQPRPAQERVVDA